MGQAERRQQATELERLARGVWGEDVGQVIVGYQVAIFHIRGNSLLLHVDHDKRGVEAAFAALRALLPPEPQPTAEPPAEPAEPAP